MYRVRRFIEHVGGKSMVWDEGAQLMARSDEIITVVLTADNHLGWRGPMNGGPFADPSRKREERLRRLRSAFQRATDFAVGQGVDVFVQVGDLFDTPSPSEEDRGFVAARLAELRQAGIHTFAVSGIHDTPVDGGCSSGDAGSMGGMDGDGDGAGEGQFMEPRVLPAGLAPQVSYARLGAMHYFPPVCLSGHSGSVELEPVMLDVHGVVLAVCGVSVVAGEEGGDPLAHVRVPSDVEGAAVSSLLLHAPIEGMAAREGAGPVVARSTIAGQAEFDVILAGYEHGFRHVRVGGTDVVVAGATQQVDFDDAGDEPGFVFLGVAADGVRWCHHVAGESLRMRRVVIHTAELWGEVRDGAGSGGRSPTDAILERLGPVCSAENVVQLQLVGEVSREQYHAVDFGRIRSYGEERCFELAIDESGLFVVPGEAALAIIAPSSNGGSRAVPGVSDEMEEGLSPRKELVNLAHEWIEAASDEQEKRSLLATKEELLAALDKMKTRRL